METVYGRCAGIDVHKLFVMTCARITDEKGTVHEDVRRFSTMTGELLSMGDWLRSQGVTHVAMESTGVFWKPVYNVLEAGFTVLLCNAQHLKQVPGRKTDVKDCQWIAQLLQCGLLRASFVPPRPIRELRDLTRHRMQLMGEINQVKNRIHKVLEDANIQLDCVATDIFGVSGRAMLEALMRGETRAAVLQEFARGRLRGKKEALYAALEGMVREHHRFMLKTHYDHLRYLERAVRDLEERIRQVISADALNPPDTQQTVSIPFVAAVERLDVIPGLNPRVIVSVLAEIGTNMEQFPTPGHLASWAGICPGNNESAGKRKSGKTTKGSPWLRRVLTEAAWAASRNKKTYFGAQYARIARRRGKKRALIAVAHSLLITIYHLLKYQRAYQDLGPDFFDRLNQQRLTNYLVKRLQSLGHTVTLTPAA